MKKQGYYDREDESDAMRLGKGHSGKKTRDESYGDWGKRSKDWKGKKHSRSEAHGGHSSVEKVLKHMNRDLAYMPIVDREKDAMRKGDK